MKTKYGKVSPQNASGSAILLTDVQGKVVMMNPFAELLTRQNAETLQGQSIHKLTRIVDPTSKQKIDLPVEELMRCVREFRDGTWQLLLKYNGTEAAFCVNTSPLIEKNGAHCGTAVIIQVMRTGVEDTVADGVMPALSNGPRSDAPPEHFYIKKDGAYIRIRTCSVDYIEAMENYVALVVGDDRHVIHATMKSMAKQLFRAGFRRIHRSYIVALERIESVDDKYVTIGDRKLPVGKSFRAELLSALHIL